MKKTIIIVLLAFVASATFAQTYPKVVKSPCEIRFPYAIQMSPHGYLGKFDYGHGNNYPVVQYSNEAVFPDSLSAVQLLDNIRKNNIPLGPSEPTETAYKASPHPTNPCRYK